VKAIGLDIGSLTTKVVIMENDAVTASLIAPSGDNPEMVAREILGKVFNHGSPSIPEGTAIVSTGVGGKTISFSPQQKTLTTCLARGASYYFPAARMVIDIGAESSSVIKINERGRVKDSANQDKCAAGTGIFLQQMSKIIQMPLDEMAGVSRIVKAKADISSTCAVFAESEVISYVHRDPPTPKADIVVGIYASVISRIMALCKRMGIEREIVVSGGVALNRGLVKVLENELGFPVLVPEKPQFMAATGAAILAKENQEKERS
jgi:(R)-2-hydroxyacyl-CoA dehydratese activating ATPase